MHANLHGGPESEFTIDKIVSALSHIATTKQLMSLRSFPAAIRLPISHDMKSTETDERYILYSKPDESAACHRRRRMRLRQRSSPRSTPRPFMTTPSARDRGGEAQEIAGRILFPGPADEATDRP